MQQLTCYSKKSEVFGQLLVQPALNTNILGAEDGAVCTITALKLLLNWGVLESMNFFSKELIFGQLLVQAALNTNILGAGDGASDFAP